MSEFDESLETWLSPRRFHQSFHLTTSSGKLRVTYSDIGYGSYDGPGHPAGNSPRATVVFIGGLMGGRYTVLHLDQFCRHHGIRLITVDRPGMGGSQHVPPAQRMATWLATFEALLDHLGLRDVAVASHSGGAIYATNTLIHCRKYLHPERPRVAFFSPFSHTGDSGAVTATMGVLKMLPGSVVAQFDKAIQVVGGFSSSVGWSSGLVVSGASSGEKGSQTAFDDEGGVNADWWAKASKYSFQCMMAEDVSGSSDEALFCLRKGSPVIPWGEAWTTYADAAKIVADGFRRDTGVLKIDVYHAASDNMVGAKGAKYFDECWRCVFRDEGDEILQYSSEICEGTNHDSVLSPDKQPLKQWLRSLVES